MTEAQQTFYYLSVALAIGLLIGVERGWEERKAEEGKRVAGIRTYGLIGLLGGGSALLARHIGSPALGLAFTGLAVVLVTVYIVSLRRGGEDVGITSLIAGLLTFVLGALAALGDVAVAAASAVVTTLLLTYKPLLHRWVNALEGEELRAGLRLLLISVVLLPILPNQGYGPWNAFNPYAIWWMVVLIATISFVGYFAIKIGGARRGVVFTGVFGGLASSTAVTLDFARLAPRSPELVPVLAMGTLLACGTMLPRMLLVATVVNADLGRLLVAPALLMALIVYVPALVYWYQQSHASVDTASPFRNPLELKAALSFGLLLACVLFLGRLLRAWFGEAGVLGLAAASGIGDVDAITLSLARMSLHEVALHVGVTGIVIAAAVNSLVKAGMAAAIGGRALGLRVGVPLVASAVAGLVAVWTWHW